MAAASELADNKTLTLLLVRHGETAWNHEGRLQGWQDVPLSPAGHEQARRLAARLARTWQAGNPARALIPGPPCALYSSDLSRAVNTARVIADHIAPLTDGLLPVEPLYGLRERNFGEREGFTADEARAKWGSDASHKNVGETYAEVNERMEVALQTIWAAHAAAVPGRNVALVAGHGGSLRLWLCRAVGLGPESVQRFFLDNTGLCVITFSGPTFDESQGRILLCNDTAHLQGERPPP